MEATRATRWRLLVAVALLLAGLVVMHGLGLGHHAGSMAGMDAHSMAVAPTTEQATTSAAPVLAVGSGAGATAALCVAVLVGLAWLSRRSATSYRLLLSPVRGPRWARGVAGVADRAPPDLVAMGISRT